MVGSGAAGGWAAKELCERGMSVLLLEAGPAVDARPQPAPPQRRLAARVRAGISGQAVQMRCAAFDARTQPFFVSDRDNPYTTPPGRPFNWFRGRQVGGRLHLWARLVPRLSDRELAAWPVSYADLAPYYDRVEEFLGVEERRMTPAEERFREAVEGVIGNGRVVSPRVVRHWPEPVPATVAAAESTGRLTLRPDSVVRSVTVDEGNGLATGVSLVDRRTRKAVEEHAEVVVLCASTIETLRIMLGSGRPDGLGNSSGLLGRRIMDHVLTGLAGPLPDGTEHSPDDGADPYDLGRVHGVYIPREGYGVQGALGRGSPTWYLLAHGEMRARDENRVVLDRSRTDAWGMPVARVDCTHSAEEEAMARDQIAFMHELAAAADLPVRVPPSGRILDRLAFRLWRRRLMTPSGAYVPGTAAHEVGGAPMGDDPTASVIDPFGRVWDVPNVIVADGACFPAGCAQNVTLTIMALAARACERVAGEREKSSPKKGS